MRVPVGKVQARDHRSLRARPHRLTSDHRRRPAGEPRRARAPQGERARPDREDPGQASPRESLDAQRSSAAHAPATLRARAPNGGQIAATMPRPGWQRSCSSHRRDGGCAIRRVAGPSPLPTRSDAGRGLERPRLGGDGRARDRDRRRAIPALALRGLKLGRRLPPPRRAPAHSLEAGAGSRSPGPTSSGRAPRPSRAG